MRLICCNTQEEPHLYSPYISVIALDSRPPPSSSLSCSAPILILMISFALCTCCHCHPESNAPCTECGSCYCSTNAQTVKAARDKADLLLHCCTCLPAKVRTALSGSLHHLVYLGIREPLDLSQALPAPWQLRAHDQVQTSGEGSRRNRVSFAQRQLYAKSHTFLVFIRKASHVYTPPSLAFLMSPAFIDANFQQQDIFGA